MGHERLTSRDKAFTAVFLVIFFAMIWPVYPLFVRIRPFVIGVPFSLFYLIAIAVVASIVLLAFYLTDPSREDDAD